MDETGLALPEAMLAQQLESLYEQDNHLLLLALDGERIIGMASIKRLFGMAHGPCRRNRSIDFKRLLGNGTRVTSF